MTVKKEYIALAVVIVALSLVLILRKSDRTHYRLPAIERVSAERITRLVISRGDSTLTLEGQNKVWKIEPYGYPADTSQVNRMLMAFSTFNLTELASEAKNYIPYELDAGKRIGVEAFEGDRSLLKLSIGKIAPTYQHTFVQLENDPRVYQAGGNLRNDFDTNIERLSDKVILTVAKDFITGIAFIGRQDSLVLRHERGAAEATPTGADTLKPKAGPMWRTADGRPADEPTVEQVINRLVSVRCEGFIAGRAKSDFVSPIFTIRIDGLKPISLSIFEKGKDAKYPAVSSESDFPFYLGEWLVTQIMKKPDELMGKKPAEKKKP